MAAIFKQEKKKTHKTADFLLVLNQPVLAKITGLQ